MNNLNNPVLPDHEKFMPGDKVIYKISGDVLRVKERYAINDTDYIALQNVHNRAIGYFKYFEILPLLELVCHQILLK